MKNGLKIEDHKNEMLNIHYVYKILKGKKDR